MFRKAYFSFILLVTFLACSVVAFGQTTAPASGIVEMEGTKAPIAGALVEAYRTDVTLAPLSVKTSKKGDFTFGGLLLGAEYALAVSGPGIAPTVFSGVKPGQDRIIILVSPGDGRKLTPNEARKAASTTKSGGGEPEMSAEDKKARQEYEEKVAANTAAKKKAEDANKLVNAALKEGAAAFDAKNYDLAVAKFDEGYQADPDFEGSAPIMLNNKGLALRMRGRATYDAAVKTDPTTKAAAAEKAKADMALALTSFDKALEIIAKAPAGDANAQNAAARSKIDALKGIVETHSSIAVMGLDPSKMAEALPALERYLAAETDDLKKMPIVLAWSNNMRLAGEMKNSIYGYRKYMEKTPDSIDAMAGLGLSLFNEGVSATPENKEQQQEGLNLLAKFVEAAPDTHPLKASVKDAIDYLKNTAKLAPQKVATPGKKKP